MSRAVRVLRIRRGGDPDVCLPGARPALKVRRDLRRGGPAAQARQHQRLSALDVMPDVAQRRCALILRLPPGVRGAPCTQRRPSRQEHVGELVVGCKAVQPKQR